MYAIRVGRIVGIVDTWDECKARVDKYPGAEYKKVKTVEEGERFINGVVKPIETTYGCYIDGSYIDKTKSYGYSLIICDKQVRYQEYGRVPDEFHGSRNIGAEFYAALRAMEVLHKLRGRVEPIIHYDYEGVEKFLTSWKPKSQVAQLYRILSKEKEIVSRGELKFRKVEAHSGDEFNNLADKLAKQGAVSRGGPFIRTNVEGLDV